MITARGIVHAGLPESIGVISGAKLSGGTATGGFQFSRSVFWATAATELPFRFGDFVRHATRVRLGQRGTSAAIGLLCFWSRETRRAHAGLRKNEAHFIGGSIGGKMRHYGSGL